VYGSLGGGGIGVVGLVMLLLVFCCSIPPFPILLPFSGDCLGPTLLSPLFLFSLLNLY